MNAAKQIKITVSYHSPLWCKATAWERGMVVSFHETEEDARQSVLHQLGGS